MSMPRILCLLVAAALPLAAQEFTWVSGQAGATFFGDSAYKSPQFHYGGSAGWWFTPRWGAELRATRSNVYSSGGDYLNHQTIATASALWRIWPDEAQWRPYLAFGFGAARNVAYGTNNVPILENLKARPELHVGAGLQHRFNARWLFTADYRLAHSGLNKTQYNDHLFTLGVGLTFGEAKPKPAPLQPAPPRPVPPPVEPTPVQAPPQAAPAPAAPEPAPVAAVPVQPAPRRKVQVKGAVVRFANGQAVLDGKGEAALAQVARSLQGLPSGTRIKVTGHASKIGPKAFNQRLSRRRAQAAAEHLVAEGVPEGAIQVEARGYDAPQADNRSRKGRALNRRAEVAVKGGDTVEVQILDTEPVTRKVVKKAGKAVKKPVAKHGKGKKAPARKAAKKARK